MRCSVLLLAALAFQGYADIAVNVEAKPKKVAEEEAAELPVADALATPAPAREEYPMGATTKMPWQRIAGPVVGGVVGVAALAGVIAMSVMKHSTTPSAFLATPPPIAAKEAGPAMAAKEAAVAVAPVPAGTTINGHAADNTATDTVSSGMDQSRVIGLACMLLACGICICLAVLAGKCCSGKKKRTRSAGPTTRETAMRGIVPEDQQPMMGTQMDVPMSAPDLNESHFMPVLPALNPGSGYAGGIGLGSVPTMLFQPEQVVPMQTMPPPPPPPQYGGSVFAGAGSQFSVNQSRFSPPSSVYQQAPASIYQQAGASVYQQAGASVYQQAGTSVYQQASPLANTVSALPTTALSGMQAPATFYG